MKKSFWIKFSVTLVIIAALLALDLITKYVFDAKLADGSRWVVIPYLFNFKIVHNFGAAWGMLAGKQVFLIVLSIIFLIFFIVFYIKEKRRPWLFVVAFSLIVAGCLGNLYDRIILGFVRDFIEFAFWTSFPTFNFADVALCVGVVLFLIYSIIEFAKSRKKDKKDGK